MSNPMIAWTRVNNDANGNGRFVCWYGHLLKAEEKGKPESYTTALCRAKQIGGKKFHNKQFGGGIVFQCVNVEELQSAITELLDK